MRSVFLIAILVLTDATSTRAADTRGHRCRCRAAITTAAAGAAVAE